MSDFMTCTHHWTVTSECPRCLREQLDALAARLAEAERRAEYWKAEHLAGNRRIDEAEALLRATVHPTQYAVIPPGWVYMRDQFLGTPDSASANCVCVRPHLATDANGLTYCTGCGAVYSRPAADQPEDVVR